jgi:hypothetical protein
MSEHQFVAFMHTFKRTVQNWNKHSDAFCEYDDVIHSPFYRILMNGQKSVLVTVLKTTGNPNREKIRSKLEHFQ